MLTEKTPNPFPLKPGKLPEPLFTSPLFEDQKAYLMNLALQIAVNSNQIVVAPNPKYTGTTTHLGFNTIAVIPTGEVGAHEWTQHIPEPVYRELNEDGDPTVMVYEQVQVGPDAHNASIPLEKAQIFQRMIARILAEPESFGIKPQPNPQDTILNALELARQVWKEAHKPEPTQHELPKTFPFSPCEETPVFQYLLVHPEMDEVLGRMTERILENSEEFGIKASPPEPLTLPEQAYSIAYNIWREGNPDAPELPEGISITPPPIKVTKISGQVTLDDLTKNPAAAKAAVQDFIDGLLKKG